MIYPAIYCVQGEFIMKRRISMADFLFYDGECVCLEHDEVHFVDFNVKRFLAMGITVQKIVICGSKSSVLRSLISFYGDAASP